MTQKPLPTFRVSSGITLTIPADLADHVALALYARASACEQWADTIKHPPELWGGVDYREDCRRAAAQLRALAAQCVPGARDPHRDMSREG